MSSVVAASALPRTTEAERAHLRQIVARTASTLATANRVPFVLPQHLPPTFAGRATAFVPDRIRTWRNRCFWLVAFTMLVDLISMGLGGARGGLSKASAGVHGVMLVVAAIEFLGHLKLSMPALVGGGIAAVGIPAVFALFVVLSITLSQAGASTPDDAILILIFIGLLVDVAAGFMSLFVAFLLASYTNQCKREDAEVEAQLAQPHASASTSASASAASVAPAPAPGSGTRNPLVDDNSAAAREGRSRGLQPLQDQQGFVVLPPNAGTSALPLMPPPGLAHNHHQSAALPSPSASAPPPSPLLLPGPTGASSAVSVVVSASVPPTLPPCDICYERARTTAFVPCGHLACLEDAMALQARIGKCHLCRRPIQTLMRVYLE